MTRFALLLYVLTVISYQSEEVLLFLLGFMILWYVVSTLWKILHGLREIYFPKKEIKYGR